jgi:hypothetical protein
LGAANNFGVEEGRGQKAIEWINSRAKENNQKFDAKLEGYSLHSINFGNFEVISWKGDWSAARNIIQKASKKLSLKVIESGYHEKSIIPFLAGGEFGKVYSGGRLIGLVGLAIKSGKWIIVSEKRV